MHDRLLEQFVHFLRGEQIAESTVRIYASNVSMYLQALAIHDISPSEATRESIGRYFQWLRSRGAAPGTLEGHQTAIRRFLAWLADTGLSGESPLAKRIRLPRRKRLVRALSQEQARALMESVNGAAPLELRDRALLELLYSSGLRAGEVIALRVRAVDLGRQTVRITGKGDREALVSFSDEASARLTAYLDHGRLRLLERQSHDRLWVNCFGGPLRYAGLHRMVSERGKAAGIDYVRPHMLRHSFATHLMEQGAHLRVIQELMRHASVRSTEVYTHIDPRRLAEERRRYHPRG